MHTPVLLKEVLEQLNVSTGGRYIDATYGEGGHTNEIISKGGNVLAFDWDNNKFQDLGSMIQKTERLELINANYADIESVAREHGFDQVDGVLFDLGLSMEQLKTSSKGFSFKNPLEKLDMRIGDDLEMNAEHVVNEYSKEELIRVFEKNAEEIRADKIAQEIVMTRSKNPIRNVGQLVDIIKKVAGETSESTIKRIFQALRIEVNNEFENIEKGILGAVNLLKSGGKLLVITFHSLEDRKVKQLLQSLNQLKVLKQIRSKSNFSFEKTAVLRVAIKI